jgi:hypothetical protein
MIRQRQTIGSGLLAILSPKDSIVCYPTGPPTFDGTLFCTVSCRRKTKRKVVVADTPPQEALSHNKTTWIVGYTGRLGKLAPIFMTAVLDQLVAEVIEQAGDDAHACKKNTIIHALDHTAVHRDRDVHSMFSNAALSSIF